MVRYLLLYNKLAQEVKLFTLSITVSKWVKWNQKLIDNGCFLFGKKRCDLPSVAYG